jgi:membrane protein implicated in regulation of membrane protease activity
MPCLLVVLALATPRLVIAVLFFFTTWFKGLFDTPLWPVLGFIFLPTSFLWFTAVQRWFGGDDAVADHRSRHRAHDRRLAGWWPTKEEVVVSPA